MDPFDEAFFNYAPHGSIANLALCNPPVPVPDKIPDISDKEIVSGVAEIMVKHPQKETYIEVFRDTLKRVQANHKIRTYLRLIRHVMINNQKLSEEKKREALIEIGEGCKGNTCLSGRLTKIQDVYQNSFTRNGKIRCVIPF
ncbi:MAG: hypothetical protein HWD61_14030 [Parachlamydiaceae bacterium]|nr:MAG: hypothetical protein HWD61_14030 [Parachlamydiaceae bacterium]